MQETRPWALARNEIPGECGSLPVMNRIVNDDSTMTADTADDSHSCR
jgi:hypothetical protein